MVTLGNGKGGRPHHETPNDHKVTLRYRDTMEQERVAISDLRSIIEERVSITSVLKKLGKEIKNF